MWWGLGHFARLFASCWGGTTFVRGSRHVGEHFVRVVERWKLRSWSWAFRQDRRGISLEFGHFVRVLGHFGSVVRADARRLILQIAGLCFDKKGSAPVRLTIGV